MINGDIVPFEFVDDILSSPHSNLLILVDNLLTIADDELHKIADIAVFVGLFANWFLWNERLIGSLWGSNIWILRYPRSRGRSRRP